MTKKSDLKNAEGYSDPTAAKAIATTEEPIPERVTEFIRAVKIQAWCSDLEFIGRFKIRDKRTGKEYR